jgi:hypothetical protein
VSADKNSVRLGAAWGQDEVVERLKDLIAKAQRGEIACVAVRMFRHDGTWEDVVIGGESDEERAAALTALQESYRTAN